MKALLEVEKSAPVQVNGFAAVEKALRALRSYGPKSFASLTKPDGSYMQVAGGRLTCVLEMRTYPDKKHFRAYYEKPKVPFEGPQTLMFGGGQLKVSPDEILFIDDVVAGFKSFLESTRCPDEIKWRDMTELLGAT